MARLTPPKSPIVYDNKHHSGCMWGLYSLFEIGQSNSNRKLISDRKQVLQRHAVIDDGNVTKPSNLLFGFDEKNQSNIKNDTKNEKKRRKEETKCLHSASEPSEPSQRVTDSAKQKKLPHPNIVGKSTDRIESAFGKNKDKKKKKRGCGCKNVDFVKYDQFLKANDVAEAIVNQKLIEGKYLSRDGVNRQSKQLLDALEILNSNKELFAKLLQDPNSLLVKHIQDLRDSQVQRREAEPLECELSNENRPQPSEIVVLKPGQSFGPIHFSFEDMKRRFKHAMGVKRKDPNLMVSIEGPKRGEREVARSKGMEDYSFDAHRRDKIEKLRDFKARIGQEMASNDSYRKHSKSSSVEALHMRFSPYGYSQVSYNDWRAANEQKSSSPLIWSTEAVSQNKVFEAGPSHRGETNPMEALSKLDDIEKNDPLGDNVTHQEDTNHLIEPGISQSSDTTNTNDETEDSESSRLDSSLEDQSSTCSSNVFPSNPSSIHPVDSPDCFKDIGESSPISVLEQFLTDVSCPPSKPCLPDTYVTISEYVKAVLQQASSSIQDKSFWDSKELDKLLCPSFIESINSKANRFCGDRKLIFDCVSDVLVELHNTHFRHMPWQSSSSLNPKILRPVEVVEKFVTREAMKSFEFLFKHGSSPQRPMEWLVGNDLRQSKAWLDIRTDAEDIVYEIAEDGLEELIMETIVDLYI